jgi:hypothetical protein
MGVSEVEARAIHKAIDQLKETIAELETRLREGPTRHKYESLTSIAVRLLVSAERIENLVSAAERLRKWLFRLFSGVRTEVQTATVKVDRVGEVLLVPKSTCRVLHPLNLGVDRLTGSPGAADK